jgi:hypothetical protein
VQLSYGLSSEYSKGPATENSAEKAEKVDADRQLYAKYYVSQIMQMGEEGIRDAWNKVSSRFSITISSIFRRLNMNSAALPPKQLIWSDVSCSHLHA